MVEDAMDVLSHTWGGVVSNYGRIQANSSPYMPLCLPSPTYPLALENRPPIPHPRLQDSFELDRAIHPTPVEAALQPVNIEADTLSPGVNGALGGGALRMLYIITTYLGSTSTVHLVLPAYTLCTSIHSSLAFISASQPGRQM